LAQGEWCSIAEMITRKNAAPEDSAERKFYTRQL
jgi:hypothetical protein